MALAAPSTPHRPVVLVTGSARRLGRAIALHLAERGWDVAVHYRGSADDAAQTVQEAQSHGARAHAFAADLADEAACTALLPAVQTHFGRVDAVVNNASLFEYDAVADFSYAAMERHWRANTAPAVVLARALHAAGGGAVVNLLDQKLWNPNPDYFSYTLSKAALEAATELLAMALAPKTRVCGVAPGLALSSKDISEANLPSFATTTLLMRLAKPDEIAQTVRFLLECSSATGTTVLIDSGQHLVRQRRDYGLSPHQES